MTNEQRKAGLIFRAVVAGVVAALAGPVGSQDDTAVQPRTGQLESDCQQFSGTTSGDRYDLKAKCRVDDETNNLTETSTDLAAEIGIDDWGNLEWGGSGFHQECKQYGVELKAFVGLELEASCDVTHCVMIGNRQDCETRTATSDLLLRDYYEVNASGQIVVK